MPREMPDVPNGWKKPALDAGRSFDIELITPMFGGGVETRVNDPSLPVRTTAIRGQLQFWWRATVGAQYTTRQELRAAQSAIWGSTERASRVQVLVENVRADEPGPCALIAWDQGARRGQGGWRTNWQAPFNGHDTALPYALFPFQGETPPPNSNATLTIPPARCILKASFRLTLRCPENLWPQGGAGALGVGKLRRRRQPDATRVRIDLLQRVGSEGRHRLERDVEAVHARTLPAS